MKNLYLVVVLLLSFVSCDNNEKTDPDPTPSLELSTLSLDFDAKKQTKTITIKSMSSDQLDISVDSEGVSWCSTSFENKEISVNVTENDGVDVRETAIIIVCDGVSKRVKVRQLGLNKVILVNPDSFSLESVASEISFKITANVNYEISTPEWVKKEFETKVESKDYTYYVDPNIEKARTGKILIKEIGGSIECKITITQESGKAKAKTQQLKVMAWNIWHGGHSDKFSEEEGCEGTLGILKKSEADVILMVETYGSSSKVANHLGYEYKLFSTNLSAYSRYPITETYTFSDDISTFNFGGIEINMNGQKVRLFDVWLNWKPDCTLVPLDKTSEEIMAWDLEGTRDEEIRTILNVLKPFIAESDSIPIIMGGDFNIHSHLDWTETTKNMYKHGGHVIEWTVSKEMEKAGFKDSFREMNPDLIKNLGITWMYPSETWTEDYADDTQSDRIDYIYYHGESIQATKSETYYGNMGKMLSFGGEEFFYASDHGFVLTSFDIELSETVSVPVFGDGNNW